MLCSFVSATDLRRQPRERRAFKGRCYMPHDDLHGRPHLLTPNNRNSRNPLDDPNKRVPRTPRQDDPNNGNKSPRVRIPGWIWWILLAGLLIWNILALANPFAAGPTVVTYTDFVAQAQAGN